MSEYLNEEGVRFREIPDIEGLYAGEDGTILSFWWFSGRHKGWEVRNTPRRQLAITTDRISGERYFKRGTATHRVARSVLLSFCGGPPVSSDKVRHINGNITDDRLENLVWQSELVKARNDEEKEIAKPSKPAWEPSADVMARLRNGESMRSIRAETGHGTRYIAKCRDSIVQP